VVGIFHVQWLCVVDFCIFPAERNGLHPLDARRQSPKKPSFGEVKYLFYRLHKIVLAIEVIKDKSSSTRAFTNMDSGNVSLLAAIDLPNPPMGVNLTLVVVRIAHPDNMEKTFTRKGETGV